MRVVCKEQYTPKWWQARRGVPTASRADKILTPKTGKPSALQVTLVHTLIGELYDPGYGTGLEDYQSAAMKNGTIIEPEARAFYEFHTNRTIDEVGLCVTDDGRFGCSPDGLCGDDLGLELKSPMHKTHVMYLLGGVVPEKYLPQIRFSMIVTGRRRWDFMSYARNLPPLLRRVEWDEKTDALKDELENFWVKYQEALSLVQDLTPETDAFAEHEEAVAVASTF